ncbi:MAG: haloalkane dehalogenase [Polycyclovorans sp.]
MIAVLRTPESRFQSLPDFPYTPHYIDTLPGHTGLRMAYIDEGPRTAAQTFLCLHGNPSWSYLYRKMIPVFLATGARVVAPDLYGFGRSDKPADIGTYHFDFHRNALLALVEHLDLRGVTLVCQDWGGILGLTLPMAAAARYRRLLVMNTVLATGDAPLPAGFLAWRDWCAGREDLAPGRLLQRSHRSMTAAEAAAYDAPFPDTRYQAGARAFPSMVCDRADAPGAAISRAARDWWQQEWRGQSFMAIGTQDPVFGIDVMTALRTCIAGCPAPLLVAEGGHFVQECGEQIARAALAHWQAAA